MQNEHVDIPNFTSILDGMIYINTHTFIHITHK